MLLATAFLFSNPNSLAIYQGPFNGPHLAVGRALRHASEARPVPVFRQFTTTQFSASRQLSEMNRQSSTRESDNNPISNPHQQTALVDTRHFRGLQPPSGDTQIIPSTFVMQ